MAVGVSDCERLIQLEEALGDHVTGEWYRHGTGCKGDLESWSHKVSTRMRSVLVARVRVTNYRCISPHAPRKLSPPLELSRSSWLSWSLTWSKADSWSGCISRC